MMEILSTTKIIMHPIVLAISGAIRGTSRENLSGELGSEILLNSRWFRKLTSLYKTYNDQSQKYFFQEIPKPLLSHSTRNNNNLPSVHA